MLGSRLPSVAVNIAGQRHHAILDTNTNLRCMEGRLPLELIHHVLLQLRIGLHSTFLLLEGLNSEPRYSSRTRRRERVVLWSPRPMWGVSVAPVQIPAVNPTFPTPRGDG